MKLRRTRPLHVLHVLLLVQLLIFTTTTCTVIGTSTDQDDFDEFLALVTTTREVASQHGNTWDIQHKGSKRLSSSRKGKDKDQDDQVLLRVIVHSQQDAKQLQELESMGLLSYETQPHRRDLEQQGINDEYYCYRTVEETYTTVEDLAIRYPMLVTVDSIGESWLKQQGLAGGNDILVMILTAPSSTTATPSITKHDMMVVAGHHSRELPPPEAVLQWAEHLLGQYDRDADITWILERTRIHVVPMANPDGREIVQENLDWLYRKNARPNGCPPSMEGVDLNRNYPFAWGSDTGSSGYPCATSFRGDAALSEPESTAVYTYASALFPDVMKKGTVQEAMEQYNQACPEDTATGLFVDVHSAGDFVYFPWGFADLESPNHVALLTLSAKLAHPGNYTLWGPGQDGFLYYVSGDATDALYGIDCVAAVGYELGSQFYASCRELQTEIVPIVRASLMYAAKTVSAPYRIPLGPDIVRVCVDNTDPSQTTVAAVASDEALIVPWAIFDDSDDNDKDKRSQPIAQVRVYVNEHPHDDVTGTGGTLLLPVDRAYDSVEETVVAILDTTMFTMGQRYTLYLQATDTQGYRGAVTALFVDNAQPQVCHGGGSGDGEGGNTKYTIDVVPPYEETAYDATEAPPTPPVMAAGAPIPSYLATKPQLQQQQQQQQHEQAKGKKDVRQSNKEPKNNNMMRQRTLRNRMKRRVKRREQNVQRRLLRRRKRRLRIRRGRLQRQRQRQRGRRPKRRGFDDGGDS